MRITWLLSIALTCFIYTSTRAVAIAKNAPLLNLIKEKQRPAANSSVEYDEDAAMQKKEQEKQKIELDNALARARLEKELAGLQADISRLMVEREVMTLQWQIEHEKKEKAHISELATLNQQKEKLEAEVSIAQYKLTKEEQQLRTLITTLDYQAQLLRAEVEQMNAQKARYEAECQRANYADTTPVYLKEPLKPDGSLVVSDRRIDLNGGITPWLANYITDRIQYFNNKDANHPIFIVIESSPGGSVSAGSCIIKAMENSKAPVYVVVKGFAASMAALITTLADKSYAYPNAIILHHQPWTFTWGNVRELREEQELLQEWWNRLGGSVAKKMGISLKKLDTLLYEKSAKGDWLEFADRAAKLKWVDHIINGIQDSGVRELPNPGDYTWHRPSKGAYGGTTVTENGVTYLPPLEGKDFYYLYNPNNRYQMYPPR
ncbi:MAG: ATP-dependent Clp protease proteolytic subunit [Bacteroidota bacterium]